MAEQTAQDASGFAAESTRQAPAANEQLLEEKRLDLQRMRRVASALLVGMAALFIAARMGEASYAWLAYVRAFAEAAMIGALADWFAVTALFRHPLGIPIPHTAIVQHNKDRIGRSLGNFVQNNFLSEDVLRRKLETVDIAARASDWLADPQNSAQAAERIARVLPELLLAVDDSKVQHFIDRTLRERLGAVEAAPLAGKLLGTLTYRNRHQVLLDASLRIAADFLEKNKDLIREKIRRESPWFVPQFVDNKIYEKIIYKVEEMLLEVNSDPQHLLRAQFNEAVHTFIERLKTSPEYHAKGEALKQEFLNSPETQSMLRDLWQAGKLRILADLTDPDSTTYRHIRAGIQRLGESLQQDESMRERINTWIREAAIKAALGRRAEIGGLIGDTVERWDGKTLAERIELQVGRDLQFIRINGTVVGGIVGLLLYTLAEWLF